MCAVERDSSTRHDTVKVRVEMQILTPSMQHGEEADGCAQMFGVGGNPQQGLGGGTEQDGVDGLRVMKRQAGDFLWQSKHDMEIGDGQKLCLSGGKPLCAGGRLTLGTVAVATRVIRDDAMPAPIALLDVAAQGGGSAIANRSE